MAYFPHAKDRKKQDSHMHGHVWIPDSINHTRDVWVCGFLLFPHHLPFVVAPCSEA